MIWIVERTFFFFPLLGYLLIFSTFGRFLAVGVLIFLGQKWNSRIYSHDKRSEIYKDCPSCIHGNLKSSLRLNLDDFIMITPVDHHSSLFSGVKVVLHMKKKRNRKKNDIKMSESFLTNERSASNYCDVGLIPSRYVDRVRCQTCRWRKKVEKRVSTFYISAAGRLMADGLQTAPKPRRGQS